MTSDRRTLNDNEDKEDNRRPGGWDVTVPVKLNVASKQDANGKAVLVTNNDTPRDFFGCLGKLVKQL